MVRATFQTEAKSTLQGRPERTREAGTATRSVRAIDSRRFATLDRYIRFCERSVSVDMLLDEARLRQNRNQSTQINR